VILYLDTSALIKLYVEEEASDAVRAAVDRASTVAASRLAYVEARAALARARREARIGLRDLRRAVMEFQEDWGCFFVVEVNAELARRAGELAEEHALRAYDALQLASALTVQRRLGAEVRFLAFDENLSGAARSAGLTVS